MHKIKAVRLTSGTVKNNFKEIIEMFVAMENTFSYMSSVKGTLAYWKHFLYDVLAQDNK